MLRRRLSLLAPTLALVAALLVAGPALSALRIGSNGPDTLTGTKGNDQLTGKKGEDVLKGLAGNDVYFFADNFSTRADGSVGVDTLVELKAGGTDTVNFRNVKAGRMEIHLVREWGSSHNFAVGPGGNRVEFHYLNQGTTVQSFVEKAIGGQGDFDIIKGGGARNTIMPGGGALDLLYDYGGYNDGSGVGRPELAASNDVFKGFADNTGSDYLWDYGGTGDILDLRPFSIDDVYIDAINLDDTPATAESLQIVTGPSSEVVVQGQFGEFYDLTSEQNMQGRIEKIIFADTTITDTSTLAQAAAVSAEARSGQQAALADAAERLAQEARALIDPSDPGGVKRTPGEGGRGAVIGPEPGAGKVRDAKDRAEKKHDEKKDDTRARHGKR